MRETTDAFCAFCPRSHRFDSLDAHREKFTDAYAYDVKTKVAAPARYRVKLPRGYDSKREKPYSALICVPGEAGFGPRDGKTSLMTSVSKKRWNDDHDVVIVELGFNTPTWLNDSSSVNHESYLLKVVLPHFLAAHNIGRMSLLGYGSGAQGALSLLARMPTTFDSVVAADAPVLGGFKSAVHEWGAEDLNRGASWGSWDIAFPKDEDFDAYDVAHLIKDPWVRDQLNYEAPRIAIIPGKKTVNELGDFTRLLDDAGVRHDVVSGFENEDIGREGDWVDAALNWLAPKMVA